MENVVDAILPIDLGCNRMNRFFCREKGMKGMKKLLT
jgi:hypothetical protein